MFGVQSLSHLELVVFQIKSEPHRHWSIELVFKPKDYGTVALEQSF